MSFGTQILKNSFWLSIGQVSNVITSFLWIALIARYIGPEQYGIYGYAFSLCSLIVLLVNFGYDQYIILNVSKDRSSTSTILNKVLSLKSYSLPFFFVVLFFNGVTKNWDFNYQLIYFIVGFIIIIDSFSSTFVSIFHSHQLMQYDVLVQLLKSFLVLVFAFLGVELSLHFYAILLLYLIAVVIRLIILIGVYKKVIKIKILNSTKKFEIKYFEIIRYSFPLFLLSIVGIMYSNLVVVIVEWMNIPLKDLGVFVAATRLQNYLMIIPSILFTVFTPAFSNLYIENKQDFFNKFYSVAKVLYFFSFVVAPIISINAKPIVNIIYGSKFDDAIPLFAIQSLMLLGGTGYLFGSAMLIIGKQYLSLLFYGLALVFIIVISVIFIPYFGVKAASWAMVSGVIVGQIVYPWYIYKYLKIEFPFKFLAKVLGVIIGSGGVNLIFLKLNFHFLVAFFPTVINLIVLFYFFDFDEENEFILLKNILVKKIKDGNK